MQLIQLGNTATNTASPPAPLNLDDGTNYRLLAVDFNAPPTEIHEVTTALADKNLQADVRTSAYRDVVISLTVTGGATGDKAGLLANLKNLAAEIAKPANLLVVQPEPSSSQKVALVIGRNPEPEFPYDQPFESACLAHVTFVLKAEPYTYAATDSEASDHLPALVPTGQTQNYTCPDIQGFTIGGERPTPSSVTITKTAGQNLHMLYFARTQPGLGIGDYSIDPAYSAWSPAAVAGDASLAHGGSSSRLAGTTPKSYSWNLDANPPDGRYRLLMRAKVNATYTGTVTVCDANAPSPAPTMLSQSVTCTAWKIHDLGEVDVPLRAIVPGGNPAPHRTLKVTGYASGASGNLEIDYFLLVPCDGLVRYHPADDNACAGTSFIMTSAGMAYVDSYADFAGVTGQTLRLEPGGQSIMVVADETVASVAAPTLSLKLDHTPRFVLWRST